MIALDVQKEGLTQSQKKWHCEIKLKQSLLLTPQVFMSKSEQWKNSKACKWYEERCQQVVIVIITFLKPNMKKHCMTFCRHNVRPMCPLFDLARLFRALWTHSSTRHRHYEAQIAIRWSKDYIRASSMSVNFMENKENIQVFSVCKCIPPAPHVFVWFIAEVCSFLDSEHKNKFFLFRWYSNP